MTVVGSRRMIVYDDTEPLEKLKIYDARVEAPAHYDSFADFTYSYHYGDAYVPYVKQEEPLKLQCQHFVTCIREAREPMTNGQRGLEVVRVLETASESLKQYGLAMPLVAASQDTPESSGMLSTEQLDDLKLETTNKIPHDSRHSTGDGNNGNGNGNGNGHHYPQEIGTPFGRKSADSQAQSREHKNGTRQRIARRAADQSVQGL
jgi:hypothetical protein